MGDDVDGAEAGIGKTARQRGGVNGVVRVTLVKCADIFAVEAIGEHNAATRFEQALKLAEDGILVLVACNVVKHVERGCARERTRRQPRRSGIADEDVDVGTVRAFSQLIGQFRIYLNRRDVVRGATEDIRGESRSRPDLYNPSAEVNAFESSWEDQILEDPLPIGARAELHVPFVHRSLLSLLYSRSGVLLDSLTSLAM
jgi:hypothetical protein